MSALLSTQSVDALMASVREESARVASRVSACVAEFFDGGAKRLPNLDKGTLNDRLAQLPPSIDGFDADGSYQLVPGSDFSSGDAWNLKLVEFSSGYVEVRAFRGSLSTRKALSLPSVVAVEGHPALCALQADLDSAASLSDPVMTQERFASSVRRSKRLCLERCLELAADHMATLTKRGKFASCDDLLGAFARFTRACKKRYGTRWRYVAVPELHSDGETWHMHVALNGFYSVSTLRRLWYRALGGSGDERGEETPGSINIKWFRHSGSAASARKVAGYIAKYVGKGLSAGRAYRKLYSTGGDLLPRRVTRWCMHRWADSLGVARGVGRWLCALGVSAVGEAEYWSRRLPSGRLLSEGFIYRTFGEVVLC